MLFKPMMSHKRMIIYDYNVRFLELDLIDIRA